MLFCGVLVKYDKLHKSLTNYEYVPLIGNMMTSRWSYEPLAVQQFKKNEYQKLFFDVEQKKSDADYLSAYLVFELKKELDELNRSKDGGADPETIQSKLQILNAQLAKMRQLVPQLAPFEPYQADEGMFSDSTEQAILSYLDEVTHVNNAIAGRANKEKEVINKALIKRFGDDVEQVQSFINTYNNESLNNMVLNKNVVQKVDIKNDRMIRKHHVGYMKPTSRFGRAHLYAPIKRIGNLEIDTLWYNMLVVWIYTLLLYITLYYDLLRKLITFMERRKLTRNQTI